MPFELEGEGEGEVIDTVTLPGEDEAVAPGGLVLATGRDRIRPTRTRTGTCLGIPFPNSRFPRFFVGSHFISRGPAILHGVPPSFIGSQDFVLGRFWVGCGWCWINAGPSHILVKHDISRYSDS